MGIRNNAFLNTSNAVWETVGTHEKATLKNVTLTHNLKDNDTVWLKNTGAVVVPPRNI